MGLTTQREAQWIMDMFKEMGLIPTWRPNEIILYKRVGLIPTWRPNGLRAVSPGMMLLLVPVHLNYIERKN